MRTEQEIIEEYLAKEKARANEIDRFYIPMKYACKGCGSDKSLIHRMWETRCRELKSASLCPECDKKLVGTNAVFWSENDN